MAKHETPPPANDEVIDDDIKKLMGLPPEEASPALDPVSEKEAITPAGVPELTESSAAAIDELASEINQQIEKTQEAASLPESEEKDTDTPSEVIDDVNDQTDTLTDVDEVVDDIIAKDSDDLLAAEDAKVAAFQPVKQKRGIRHFFSTWWHSKRARSITLLILVIAIATIVIIPFTRYKILNLFGVRASISLQVVDEKSGFPIKNVEVTAGGASSLTDDNGKTTLYNVLLGKTQLELKKRSFSTVDQTIVVGWGSNPFVDPFQMQAVGTSFTFVITDALSGKPVDKATVTDGESIAVSGSDGRAILTLQPNADEIAVTIKSGDYRDEKTTIPVTNKEDIKVLLYPAKPDVFVSKRSGKYDLYKRDIDGQNEAVLMAGNGNEQDSIGLLVHPDAQVAAYVTTRDGKRNKDGYLLSNLYLVDVTAKTASKVDGTESEQIQLIDWIGNSLIFVKIVAGPSGNTAGRQKIISYDIKQGKATEIASANYFNDVEVFNDKVYYAINGSPQLVRIEADNSAKTVILNNETWTMYRTTYDKLLANTVGNKWFEQTFGEATMKQISGAPANPTHRIYVDNFSSTYSVWRDVRDGKGVLLLHDIKNPGEDKVIATASGLNYPIRWLSDKHLILRISTPQETADYVLNIEGGTMKKIGDVTNTAATNRWYYFN